MMLKDQHHVWSFSVEFFPPDFFKRRVEEIRLVALTSKEDIYTFSPLQIIYVFSVVHKLYTSTI